MSTGFLDSLLASLPVGHIVLSDLKFFEPRPRFIETMKAFYPITPIFDIGAGVGHVSLALAQAGLSVTAIDLIPRETPEFPITLANSVSYTFPADAVLLFCRPCHNAFVEATIRNGIQCGVEFFVYVGLPKNTSEDLGCFRRRFLTVERKMGMENETMYVMGMRREAWAGQ